LKLSSARSRLVAAGTFLEELVLSSLGDRGSMSSTTLLRVLMRR
jgi:hypothetical protein